MPRILLVEDHEGAAATMKAMLNALGFARVHHARDTEAAIAALKEQPFDLLLCDYQLGIVSGLTLVKLIRRPGGLSNPMLPIVMVTAHAEGNLVQEALGAGVDDFLAKPVQPETLLRCLNSVLTKPRGYVKTREYAGPDRRRRKVLDNPGRREEDQKSGRPRVRNPWIVPPKT